MSGISNETAIEQSRIHNVRNLSRRCCMSLKAHSRKWPQWQNPPLVLLAYLVFAIFASVLGFSVSFAPQFYELIAPVIGSTTFSFYFFTVHLVIFSIITPGNGGRYVERMLLVGAIFGVVNFFLHVWRKEDFGNPYLMYSPWRPFIEIALPLFWVGVLRSPTMTRWNERAIPGGVNRKEK